MGLVLSLGLRPFLMWRRLCLLVLLALGPISPGALSPDSLKILTRCSILPIPRVQGIRKLSRSEAQAALRVCSPRQLPGHRVAATELRLVQ